MLPASASRHARTVLAEKRAALASVQRSWRRMGPEFDTSWAFTVGPLVLAATVGAQDAVAAAAATFVPSVLAETGQRVRDLEYEVPATAWAGTAGDGRSVETLTYGAVSSAKTAVRAGATTEQALAAGGLWLTKAVGTVLADTVRGAEQANMKSRRVGTYVRMLNPPSCGRCVILAGKTYGSSEAFARHPGCDCVHIPATESIAADLTVNPHEYLDSLDDEALRKALGSKANAQAWRDGADVNQLINAYRRSGDVRTAQVYGRAIKFTTEGTTRRGWANFSMRQAGYAREGEAKSGRYMALKAPRLMPASIYQIAENREDAQRLLKLYGWIL